MAEAAARGPSRGATAAAMAATSAPAAGAADGGPPAAAPQQRRRPHDDALEEDVAPLRPPAPPAAAGSGEEDDEGALGWDVWCIAQGVAAACVGAVTHSEKPDAACVDAQPPGGAREPRPARLLERGCGMPVGCGAPQLQCGAELGGSETPAPPRPPPPEGWEYCGPEDDDLRCVPNCAPRPPHAPVSPSLCLF